VSDKALRQNVHDEPEVNPGLDSSHTGVTVSAGIVPLTGHSDYVHLGEAQTSLRGYLRRSHSCDETSRNRRAGRHVGGAYESVSV
jgi:hypothetical protein